MGGKSRDRSVFFAESRKRGGRSEMAMKPGRLELEERGAERIMQRMMVPRYADVRRTGRDVSLVGLGKIGTYFVQR